MTNSVDASLLVEVRDEAGEVLRKAQEVKDTDHLAVVRGGKGTLEVKEAHDYILALVGVGVLYTEARVGHSPRAGAARPESFLFRAEDLACLDVIRSKGYNAGGPKLIKSIGQRERAVIV